MLYPIIYIGIESCKWKVNVGERRYICETEILN